MKQPAIPLNQHNDFAGYARAMRTAAGRAGMSHHHVALGMSTHVAINKSDATPRAIQIELFNADDIEQDSDRAASAGTPTVAAVLGLRLGQFPAPTLGRIHQHVLNFSATHGGPGGERRDSLLLTALDFIKCTPTRTSEEQAANEKTFSQVPQPSLNGNMRIARLRNRAASTIRALHEDLPRTVAKIPGERST